MNLKLISFLIVFMFVVNVKGAKILGIFHITTHSHQQLGTKLLYELAARGHEVTFITPVPKKEAKNVTIVQFTYAKGKPVSEFFEFSEFSEFSKFSEEKVNLFMTGEKMAITEVLFTDMVGLQMTEQVLNSTKIKEFLAVKQNFDMVILESFLNEAFKGFCYHFNAHCVLFSPLGPNRWTNTQMGNPNNPSYMSDFFVRFFNNKSFYERLFNTFITVSGTLYNHFFTFPKQNELLQKYFPGAPHLNDLYYNTSLMLMNSHECVNAPIPLVPNMIPVGGFHIDPPKALAKDLQEYLDGAKNGAIYFSMGSNLQSVDFKQETLTSILKVFKKLDQRILWKFENDTLLEKHNNVLIKPWFPQGDILAHPNVKLFITHGGLLSSTEAVYHGVPIIGIPIYGDQSINIEKAVESGYGLHVPYNKLSEETFGAAIHEALTNPKYRKNAQSRSKIMHDEPIKPLDKAVHWIEYVLKHNGASHLRTSALNLKWYQYLLLDVIVFACLFALTSVFVLYVCVRMLIKKMALSKSIKAKIN